MLTGVYLKGECSGDSGSHVTYVHIIMANEASYHKHYPNLLLLLLLLLFLAIYLLTLSYIISHISDDLYFVSMKIYPAIQIVQKCSTL